MVPFAQKECPTSIKHKEAWPAKNPEKTKIAVFRFWELYDREKNDLMRIECICGYSKNDPDMAIPHALKVQRQMDFGSQHKLEQQCHGS